VRGGSASDDGDSCVRVRRLIRGNLHSSDTGDVMRALCAREHGHRREALPALDAIRLADWCVGRSRVRFGGPNTHVDG
jgi:hypothetical protein